MISEEYTKFISKEAQKLLEGIKEDFQNLLLENERLRTENELLRQTIDLAIVELMKDAKHS